MQAASIALAVTGGCALAATVAIELATAGPVGRRQLRRGRTGQYARGWAMNQGCLPAANIRRSAGCCAGRRPTGDDAAWQLGPRL